MQTYEVSPYSLERAIEQYWDVLGVLEDDPTCLRSEGPEANLILDIGESALHLWYPDGTACQPPARADECGECGERWCGLRGVAVKRTGDDNEDLEKLWYYMDGELKALLSRLEIKLRDELEVVTQAMQTISLNDVWEIASESVDVHDAGIELARECGIMPLMSWNDVIPGVYPDPSGRLVSWTYHPVYNDVIEVWA